MKHAAPSKSELRQRDSAIWRSLVAFERSIGGRDVLIEKLSAAKLDWKQQQLLNLLLDPIRRNDSLSRLLADANLAATELIEFLREQTFRTAFAEAQSRLMERLPAVVEDVAEKAVDRNEDCGCTYNRDGSRKDPEPKCPRCEGRGFSRQRSSFPHQQLMFEAAELLKKGGGVSVAVTQQQSVVVGSAFFDRFVKATDPAITVESLPLSPPEKASEASDAPEDQRREDPSDPRSEE